MRAVEKVLEAITAPARTGAFAERFARFRERSVEARHADEAKKAAADRRARRNAQRLMCAARGMHQNA